MALTGPDLLQRPSASPEKTPLSRPSLNLYWDQEIA
jgi:hypothetical protein